MAWKLIQTERHPTRPECAELWEHQRAAGLLLCLLLLPFAWTYLLVVYFPLCVLWLIVRSCLPTLWRAKPQAARLAWLQCMAWRLGSPSGFRAHEVRIVNGPQRGAILQMKYGLLSGAPYRPLHVVWHPALPVLALKMRDDIYEDRLLIDASGGPGSGSAVGLENYYEWRGVRFVVDGFTPGSVAAAGPEDSELVNWAREVCGGRTSHA